MEVPQACRAPLRGDAEGIFGCMRVRSYVVHREGLSGLKGPLALVAKVQDRLLVLDLQVASPGGLLDTNGVGPRGLLSVCGHRLLDP
eukprot:12867970-Alexandrium_andersonii.AAC.1